MLFHSEQQRKTLGVPSEGFSIPNSCVEWFESTGYLPAICRHLTI